MAYNISKTGKKVLSSYKNKGKNAALIPPHYKPASHIFLDWLIGLTILGSIPAFYFVDWYYGAGLIGLALVLFGIKDLFAQDDHAITRIYGPMGRARYIVEDLFRDKYLQYFNETNTNGRPIPKIVRDYIYQKAHGVKAITSFGTELDMSDPENTTYARVLHRNFPGTPEEKSYEVNVGEHRKDVRPFKVINSLNISAMSYGSLNYKACEAMSLGTKDVAFLNTGEGGYGPHGVAGNDVVFQIGTGKFGVGDTVTLPNGKESRKLNEQLLVELVKQHDNLGMVQLKITQGAKPGLGGHLPGSKVTPAIAAVRKVPVGKSVISPSVHYELLSRTPKEHIEKLLDYVAHLRKLTERPISIKFCVGRLEEIDMLVQGMKAKGDGPDHIQIDGADGGTGAADNLWINYVGYGGCVETLAYLDQRLKEAGIRDRVKLSASGKMFTPAHAVMAFAYGADWVESARGAMLALGCIQSLHCHSGKCPTGIATHNKWRMHGLSIPEKSTRVHKYLSGFHDDMMKLTHNLGHADPRDITPADIRTVTWKGQFAKYYDEDPFGYHLPTVENILSQTATEN